MKTLTLTYINICLLIGMCIYACRLPQRVYNRIDYPVGTKLRVKRRPIPSQWPDTIQVTGYYKDKIWFRTLSGYQSINGVSGIQTNEILHEDYLPLK